MNEQVNTIIENNKKKKMIITIVFMLLVIIFSIVTILQAIKCTKLNTFLILEFIDFSVMILLTAIYKMLLYIFNNNMFNQLKKGEDKL